MTKNNEDFVKVFFEGLMICCFNPKKDHFETAILRKDDHTFTVRVAKYNANEKIEEHEYSNIESKDLICEIEGKGNPEVSGFSCFQSGSFNRKDESSNDQKDFRWLVDLESEEFHDSIVVPTKESASVHNMPLNKIYVKNAHFSVDQLTYYECEKVEDDDNGNELKREFYGKYGHVLAATINSDETLLNFYTDVIPNLNLKRDAGFNYKIFITNTREGGDDENELPVYYKVLRHPSGKRFNLEKIEDVEVEMYTRISNCGKLFLSKTECLDDFS